MSIKIKSKGKLPNVRVAKLAIIGKATSRIQAGARSNAPYDTGTLRRSITTSITSERGRVGTNLPYAKIREYGGTIRPKKAKMLAWEKKGKWYRAKKVKQKGKPYLMPAFEKVREQMGNIIYREVKKTTK